MTLEIKPEVKAYCNIKEALEYLAMGWKPYKDNDERLLSDDREDIRCYFDGEKLKEENKHFFDNEKQIEYYNKMYKAIGILGNIIRNSKINIYTTQYKVFFHKNSFSYEEEQLKEEVLTNREAVYIYYDGEGSVYKKTWIVEIISKPGSVCYDGNCRTCIKFSELEPFYTPQELPEEKQYKAPAVSYTTPYLELINIMLQKGYVTKDNSPLADNLKEDIKKEAEAAGINVSNRMAASMATILRSPELQKGGYKK